MHNHDDKYPARLEFEPGTSRFQAPVDTDELSGPAFHGDAHAELGIFTASEILIGI